MPSKPSMGYLKYASVRGKESSDFMRLFYRHMARPAPFPILCKLAPFAILLHRSLRRFSWLTLPLRSRCSSHWRCCFCTRPVVGFPKKRRGFSWAASFTVACIRGSPCFFGCTQASLLSWGNTLKPPAPRPQPSCLWR